MAAVIGASYVSAFVVSGGQPFFYQDQFGPAVMLACGGGYVNPADESAPALQRFLTLQEDQVACSAVTGIATRPLTSRQTAFRYLMMTVGWTWRLTGGPAWSGLLPLYAGLFGLTVALGYLVFRQGMGVGLSLLLAGAWSVSTLHLTTLPDLRDFAKAPFVVGLVLLAICLVRGPATPRRVVALAAAAGAATGIGIGFRSDLLVAVPALMGVIAVFLPLRLREATALKLSAIAAYLLLLVLAMTPLLSIYRTGGGNSSQHLILLGLSQPFSDALGVDSGGLYDWGHDYRDEYVHAMVSDFGARRLGQQRFQEIYGPDYDRAASAYLSDIARNFPADMLVRVYASGLRLLSLPVSVNAVSAPAFLTEPTLVSASHARAAVLEWLAALWPLAYLVTLAALMMASVRLGIFAVAMLLYLAGYPALQFHERHYFQLEFIAWWVLGFAVSLTATALWAAADAERRVSWVASIRPAAGWWPAIRLGGFAWAIGAVLIVGPLWALRSYQQSHVRQLLHGYASAPQEEVPLAPVVEAGLARFVSLAAPGERSPADPVRADYLVADFGGERCDTLRLDATLRYAHTEPQFDFTRRMPIPLTRSGEVTRVLVAAFSHPPFSDALPRSGYHLAAIELPENDGACLTRLARVAPSALPPVLLGLRLPPRWDEATLYQTITSMESRTAVAATPRVYTAPPELPVSRSVLDRTIASFAPSDVALHANTLAWDNHSFQVSSGWRQGDAEYLVEMKPRRAAKGDVFMAEGRLAGGGVTVGLVRGSTWAAQVAVGTPGDFVVALQVPEDGDYAVVVANDLAGKAMGNTVSITRAGFIHD